MIAADKAGGASTIDVPAGLYKLTIKPTGSDDQTSGDLNITSGASVTVAGAGSDSTTLSGNSTSRLFSVEAGASLTLSGMTLRQGNSGGDTYPAAGTPGGDSGGAIYTDGGLTVGDAATGHSGDVVFADNQSPNYACGSQNCGGESAGAIYADYDLFIKNSSPLSECDFGAQRTGEARLSTLRQRVAVPRQVNYYCNGGSGGVSLDSAASTPSYVLDHDLFQGNTSSDGDGGAVARGAGTLESSDSS